MRGGGNSCASLAGLVLCFTACFILLVIASLDRSHLMSPAKTHQSVTVLKSREDD